jgi:hypothetical protein
LDIKALGVASPEPKWFLAKFRGLVRGWYPWITQDHLIRAGLLDVVPASDCLTEYETADALNYLKQFRAYYSELKEFLKTGEPYLRGAPMGESPSWPGLPLNTLFNWERAVEPEYFPKVRTTGDDAQMIIQDELTSKRFTACLTQMGAVVSDKADFLHPTFSIYKEIVMSNTKILAKDIHVKWSKLNEADLTNVKSHDALSALVVKGYGFDKAKADADVTAWMAGRSF